MIKFLSKFPFFSYLQPFELEFISQLMVEINIEKGDVLFNEGDPGDAVYFILEGALEVVKISDFGDVSIIATLAQGNAIGEMSLIDSKARSATTRALVRTKLVKLSKRMFDKTVSAAPKVGVALLKGLVAAVSDNLRLTSAQLSNQ